MNHIEEDLYSKILDIQNQILGIQNQLEDHLKLISEQSNQIMTTLRGGELQLSEIKRLHDLTITQTKEIDDLKQELKTQKNFLFSLTGNVSH